MRDYFLLGTQPDKAVAAALEMFERRFDGRPAAVVVNPEMAEAVRPFIGDLPLVEDANVNRWYVALELYPQPAQMALW